MAYSEAVPSLCISGPQPLAWQGFLYFEKEKDKKMNKEEAKSFLNGIVDSVEELIESGHYTLENITAEINDRLEPFDIIII